MQRFAILMVLQWSPHFTYFKMSLRSHWPVLAVAYIWGKRK